jgi:ABC-type phosphate transport system permease subunit
MVSGGAFSPNPLDGLTFFFEPVQPLAATIAREFGGQSNQAILNTIYAISAVLLVSATLLSLAGWAAKQSMKRYGIRA